MNSRASGRSKPVLDDLRGPRITAVKVARERGDRYGVSSRNRSGATGTDAQTDDGGMTEMTFSDHRGGENFKKNHKNTGQEKSKVDRNKFRQIKRKHWEDQWDSGRWSGGCFDEVNESNRTNGTSGSKGEKME